MICRVRTTTASWTSPFFTEPSGAASLMWTLMTSPMPAYVWLRPSTPIFHAIFAPVLSATSKLERTCNINFYRLGGDGFGDIALDHFHQAPAFELLQRWGFLAVHGIAV